MNRSKLVSAGFILAAAIVGGTFVCQTVLGSQNVTSSVTVSAATPVISSIVVNHGSNITLSPNTTTNVDVNAVVSNGNGCSNITGGTTTILLYRNGVTSSTCFSTANNLNCYIANAFTASSTCTTTSINTTTTFAVQYFAQATDASSSFPTDGWRATVIFRSPSNATGSGDSATTSLLTTLAINVTTSSINYGTLSPLATSPVSTTTVTNAGNSSSTLQLSAVATLTSGSNSIATSSQHYATSSFAYGGSEQQLSASGQSVSGFVLTTPTTTTNVKGDVFWALQVPSAQATGTYSGTNAFTAVFSP